VRLARHQELVELRRPDGGAGEHRVRLAAVVHLVVEQVGDDVHAPLALDAACAAVHRDDVVERSGRERVDVGDEALVGARLLGGERRERNALRRRVPDPLHVGVAVQRREVVEIDGEDVLERLCEAREETRPRRPIVRIGKGRHRRVQPVIRETVRVHLRAQEGEEIHRCRATRRARRRAR
jgi:hypothetical protein